MLLQELYSKRPVTLFEVKDSPSQRVLACLMHPMEESSEHIVKSLLQDVNNTWSTMVMRTRPFSEDLFQSIYPNHQVRLSCKPHRPGYHQWRPTRSDLTAEIKELQPDVIVEWHPEAKYYHYDPADMCELVDFNANVENLVESDNIVTVQHMETDKFSAALTLNDNFQELEKACPEWQQDTLRQYIKNGLNIINPDTSPKIQVALFAWKKQEAKHLIAVEKVTASPE